MSESVDLSIVIVNWNAHKVTAACIESIIENVRDLKYEILLIDNGSTDGSLEYLRDYQYVNVVGSGINLGFARANNVGMQRAIGRFFLLLNNDTVILDDVIQRCVEFLRSHPMVGMMGCKLLNVDRSLQRSCSRFPQTLTSLIGRQVIARRFRVLRPNSECRFSSAYLDDDHKRELRPDWIMGAFMMVRRETALSAGLLDEDYFMYAEDMDWCYRIRRTGWEIAYSPERSIIHLGGESSRMVPEATLRRRLASSTLFFRKHHPDQLWASIIIQYVSLVLELVARTLAFPVAGSHNRDECTAVMHRLRVFPTEIRRATRQDLLGPPALLGKTPC